MIAGDQYVADVLPARMFREEFARRRLAPPALSAPATPVSELPAPTPGRAPLAVPAPPRPVTELPAATPPAGRRVGPVTEIATDPAARPVAEAIDAQGAAAGAGAYASANRARSGN